MSKWELKALGEICDIRTGKLNANAAVEDGKYPFFTCSRETFRIDHFAFDCEAILLAGNNAVGDFNVKHYKGKFNAYQRTYVITLKPGKQVLYRYLYLQIEKGLAEFKSQSVGAGTKFLKLGIIQGLKIPIPPITEQNQIVSILDEVFEGIDRAIANTEKNLTNARELFESYLNAIFTQQGNGWVEKKLLDVCKRITVGHVGSMKSEYQESGVPFLRSQNILPFAVSLEKVAFIGMDFHDSLKKSKLKPGDVAIVRTGYPGTAAVIPESLPDSNCSDLVIVTPGSEVNPYYLCLFFNSAFGKNMVSGNLVGAAQKHFNVTAAKNVTLPCPSISQQEQLVSMCDEFSTETKRLEAIYQQKLAALNELKQSILQKAFTGELTSDTHNQATKLLEEVAA